MEKQQTQQRNIAFVTEVEKYPCLYNHTLTEYSIKNVTDKAWADVGESVNISAFQAKEKWRNLRSVFVRNLRPRKGKKRKYYLTDVMQFILPYIKLTGSAADNASSEVETEQNSPPRLRRESYQEVLCASPEASPSPQSDQSYNIPQRKRRTSENDDNDDEYLKPTSKQSDLKSSANKMFLLSLLPDLNNMTAIQSRQFKRRVLDLIEDICAPDTNPLQTQTSASSCKIEYDVFCEE